MLSNNDIKLIRSLEHKKHRHQHKLFVAEGEKILKDVINNGCNIKRIFLTKEGYSRLENDILSYNINAEIITEKELNKISFLTTANTGLALLNIFDFEHKEPIDFDIVLMLDAIRDPGNLGTIIRIADWFGIKNIICSKDTVDFTSPKVIQATMGSFLKVSINYCNLEDYLKSINKTTTIYASSLNGSPLNEIEPKKPAIIIIGNESKGISENLMKLVDEKIKIPCGVNSGAESLNAAVATAIIAYHTNVRSKRRSRI